MAQIELSNLPGAFAEFDDADAARVAVRSWFAVFDKRLQRHTYPFTGTPRPRRGTITMHLFILGRAPVGMVWDHIDGNGFNNRRSNLRLCSALENGWNRRVRKDSASGFKGVMLERCGDNIWRWRANVVAGGVKYRKWFASAEEADAWARAKREEVHGAFARHA